MLPAKIKGIGPSEVGVNQSFVVREIASKVSQGVWCSSSQKCYVEIRLQQSAQIVGSRVALTVEFESWVVPHEGVVNWGKGGQASAYRSVYRVCLGRLAPTGLTTAYRFFDASGVAFRAYQRW